MHDTSPAPRWTLRDLPLAARLSIAAFLLSVGLGYLTALVNLHFAEAGPGDLLPSEDSVLTAYRGKTKVSAFERVLTAHPSLPFNGTGSMRPVFIGGNRAAGWKAAVKKKARELKLDLNAPAEAKKAEAAAQKELDTERLTLIAWARAGFNEQAFKDDAFARPPELAAFPVQARFLNQDNTIKIKSVVEARCVNCHSESTGGAAANYPLDDFDQIRNYASTENGTGKSLSKLALTTHAHLLGFAMLYGLTGLALALSSCPAWVRVPIAPLALVASVIDVGFWWLARMEEPYGPQFTGLIRLSGGVVAGALVLQIVLTTFSLFGRPGRVVLVLLFVAAAAGGYVVKEKVIDPHILYERQMMQALDPEKT